jgi:hypothetical protein
MDMAILRCLKGLCGAAALAGAMAALQVPAEARRADAIHLAAGTKAETATHTIIHQVKSVPRPKKRRCTG